MGEGMPRLLTVNAAASIVGYHPETLRKAIREGRLEAYRRPRGTRIEPDALKAYMDLYLCPASDQTDHFSNYTGARTALSGGKAARDGAPRRAMRMNAALDRH
ncbi:MULTISPECIES: helix-turn-helix domain-containing protein [Asaia]|uniref:helix-turn-helix domain-containing protein n=1 Tax=Asaia TaxID=91914 RepID=UPI00255362DB|nr:MULTISPECIES: helix-turn-helix domain-containing protein [Asaia]MDL2172425.1 helix-turn-helix domain-containing protein [Asaia sp. HumB]